VQAPTQIAVAPEPVSSVPTLADLIAVDDLRAAPREPADKDANRVPPARVEDSKSALARDHELSLYSLDDAFAPLPEEPNHPAPMPALVEEAADPLPAAGSDARGGGKSRARLIAALVVAAALLGGGIYAARVMARGVTLPAPGTLVVQSSPAGIEVFVDGVTRGTTPAKVSVAPGSHILELRGRGVPRVIPLQVAAGAQVSQYLEFADTPTTGMLVVHSQPAGASVTVDGVPRGVAPLTLEGLSSGDHEVVLQNGTATSRHTVKVLAGTTASLVGPLLAAAPAVEGPVSGWISVKAPFVIEIRENGHLIGTTETDRLMLASGRHVLEFLNDTVGYRQSRTVQVLPGKVSPLAIELPQGTVNLNAAPWAEVWIDGRRVGETPIGNLSVPIGPHEIVFRHPELGEKKHAISVTTAAPVRLSVSMK